MIRKYAIAAAFTTALSTSFAHATLQGPAYPPPNDVTVTPVGENAGAAGGITFQFTNVDLTDLTALYWGLDQMVEVSLNTLTHDYLTYTGHTSTTATWLGTSTLYTLSGQVPHNTRLTITLTGAATFIDASSVGVMSDEVVVAVISGDFSANFRFELDDPANADPYDALFVVFDAAQNTAPSDIVQSGFGAGFWWDGPLYGDMNCDDVVDLQDISPFGMALVDADAYMANWPACDILLGDMNRDGLVNGLDLAGFVAALLGP
ncbi:MAG TPA: hypothetical protein P5081_11305 [Phycisphaerae bacterium]|nr:hypothetical protein [Phycisphaerae bacterium]HRW53467.1 hypothetical protein [Phycisphaerae bacterium]